MAVPKFYELCKPLLEALKDGQPHTLNSLASPIAGSFRLSREDLEEMLPSGRQSRFLNRLSWAKTHLKKAGLLDTPERGTLIITEQGLNVLRDNPPVIDINYFMRFEGYRSFRGVNAETGSHDATHSPEGVPRDELSDLTQTPDDLLEEAFTRINNNLADEVLSEVMKLSETAFEQMVIDLLAKMGYGAFENAGRTTPASNDEGIDGVIMEDKLGFSLIYIQAKKWDSRSTVGRPQVQAFVGAISGRGGKGLFVTTAGFSRQAEEYARSQHIILIDGDKLARLMIAHNFCVSVKKIFEIKAIDQTTRRKPLVSAMG